jgi:hypothetical protein
MYTILKHLSACLNNIDIGLMHHQSLPLVVEKSFDWAPAACSSRLANRTSPSAYNNIFFRPLDFGGVALVKQARSGLASHDITAFCRSRTLRALFVPFHLRSRRQPAFCLHPQLDMSSCLREHSTSGLCFHIWQFRWCQYGKNGGKMI